MSDNKTEWPEELPPGAEERKPNPFAGLPPEFAALAGLGDLAPMLTSTIAVYSQAGAEFLKWAKRLTSPSLVKLITATSAAGLEEKLNTFLQSDGIKVQRLGEMADDISQDGRAESTTE